MSNLKYWLWLTQRKGLAGQSALRVLSHFGTPEQAYFADRGAYELMGGLPREALRSLADKRLDGADRILGDCDRLGIRLLTLQDATYPERLAAIHQPPMVLYWKGRQIAFDEEVAIAVVGMRDATPYGKQTAARLSVGLVRSGALVVSGIAQGIDAAAIRGALKAGGTVVSVLGGGIDVVYPRYHKELFEDVAAVGALISEYPPGTKALASHFPVRNRIISGLSVGVVAVESRGYGGSLLTVGHALEQNREVFAVPGPVGAAESEGTNRLIQEGAAKLVINEDDILCEFMDRFPGKLRRLVPMEPEAQEQRLEGTAADAPSGQEPRGTREEKKTAAPKEKEEYLRWADCKDKLTDDQRELLLTLDGGTLAADDLVERTQIPARRVLSALTLLQVDGLVTEESGKRFKAEVKLKME